MSEQCLAPSRLVPVTAATSPDPACLLLPAIGLDSADTPRDVIDALILAAFTEGSRPFARTARLQEVRRGAAMVPAGATVLRAAVDGAQEALLATGDGWTVRSVLWRSGTAEVTVTAVSSELAESLARRIADGAEVRRPADEALVTIGFWHRLERRGAYRFARTVRAPAWLDIRMNYGSATAAALDQLMAVTPDDLAGQLLLLYGPPGTGKTTALRALARERQRWCETDCVLDPEALFADPGYLTEAALGDDETPGEGRWRLLLLEDCDELISADAKRASGQALSRLLNLTDGLLGQGRRVLVAITTNEDIRSLHPAVVRPGRCLAQIEVGPLAAAEAAAWLGAGGDVASPLTLADLYARRRAGAPISSALPPARVGLYL
ncbi:MAG TPA: DUF5925 domain-containing protein [Streptosporangiaceae bacterium]|nr:DUF5925 domain-containing protein [Streptosporangiaceae bacterium]